MGYELLGEVGKGYEILVMHHNSRLVTMVGEMQEDLCNSSTNKVNLDLEVRIITMVVQAEGFLAGNGLYPNGNPVDLR